MMLYYLKIVPHLSIGILKLINHKQIKALELYLTLPLHNLIEYNDNYSKTSRSLQQYHRDEPTSNNYIRVTPTTSNPESFKFKNNLNIYANGTENIEIAVLLKQLGNK